ncbi:hypothetical protein TNCV_4427741 [Trichonephila clavipes]|nr:hypothetical protein TNCV_4427741 [Trichonephila clavipes]
MGGLRQTVSGDEMNLMRHLRPHIEEESFLRKLRHPPEEPPSYVLKPSPCLHNGNEVDDWMGLDEWNSWFKSQVPDLNRSQDIVNLNKF